MFRTHESGHGEEEGLFKNYLLRVRSKINNILFNLQMALESQAGN
jgi:hypothetical protein